MSGMFVKKANGSPWPKGFEPIALDPFAEIERYVEWLQTLPSKLQEYVDSLPETEKQQLVGWSAEAIGSYQMRRHHASHADAMKTILHAVW